MSDPADKLSAQGPIVASRAERQEQCICDALRAGQRTIVVICRDPYPTRIPDAALAACASSASRVLRFGRPLPELLEVLADRGYFSGEDILACEPLGATPYVPKPLTSGAKADGRFGKQNFIYEPAEDVYRCPAGQKLPRHMTTVENGMVLHRYWDLASCTACALKPQCTTGKERRITRWEHDTISG